MTLSPTFQLALQKSLNPFYDLVTLPDWFTEYRPSQVKAIEEILKGFSEVDLVVLDAPTGTGKTLIADSVRQLMSVSALYMCTTKTLQDQVGRDFPYGVILKGRNNYPTGLYPQRFNGSRWDNLSCADCTKSPGDDNSCQWCESVQTCAYERAKRKALASNFSIVNTSYFLTECNGPGRFSGRGLVIADESDCIEKELMGYVEVEISDKRIKQYKLPVPKVTVEESWKEWVEEVYPIIQREGERVSSRIPSSDLRILREGKYLVNLLSKLRLLKEGLESGTWLYTGDKNKVSFKPVTVEGLGEGYLWKHGKKWLLMSGTVISSQELLESLGWTSPYRTVKLSSTFKLENRRVVVRPVADMSKKGRDNGEDEELVKGVTSIVSNRPESILIHTVSYDLARIIGDSLKSNPILGGRQILSYESADRRESSLSKFTSEKGSIILAPSFDRGIDLPGELCRVQIIAKIPYLNINDKQVAKRLYGGGQRGRTWYTVQAVRTLIQMCGRGVRGPDDWCVTYILDKQFQKLYSENRGMFPNWWREGVIWER